MNKAEFLAEIRRKIQGLPQSDIEKFLDYYAEMIDDYTEDGHTEEEAIRELGSVEQIVEQILKETPLPRLVQEKVRPTRTLRAGEIILLLLGSPLWVPMVLAVLALFFGAYVLLWTAVAVLYAIDLSAFACGAAGVFSILPFALSGNLLQGIFLLGVGLIGIGVGLLFLFVCNKVAVLILHGSKWLLLRVKHAFVGKGEQK
ncbi:MAG: DUF1700 domain-containing protein [Lachnospiraceae bacterium]